MTSPARRATRGRRATAIATRANRATPTSPSWPSSPIASASSNAACAPSRSPSRAEQLPERRRGVARDVCGPAERERRTQRRLGLLRTSAVAGEQATEDDVGVAVSPVDRGAARELGLELTTSPAEQHREPRPAGRVPGLGGLAIDGLGVRLAPRLRGQQRAEVDASVVVAGGDRPAVRPLGLGLASRLPAEQPSEAALDVALAGVERLAQDGLRLGLAPGHLAQEDAQVAASAVVARGDRLAQARLPPVVVDDAHRSDLGGDSQGMTRACTSRTRPARHPRSTRPHLPGRRLRASDRRADASRA